MIIEDEHNHCWPSLAPLNVTAGTQKDFYWHLALPQPLPSGAHMHTHVWEQRTQRPSGQLDVQNDS